VVDGTTVQRPGSRGTTARVRFAKRRLGMAFPCLDDTDKNEGETLRIFTATAARLCNGYRGYANTPGVAALVTWERMCSCEIPRLTAGQRAAR
jgi:hypothetical protein